MGVAKRQYVRLVELDASIAVSLTETLGAGGTRSMQFQAYMELMTNLTAAHTDGVLEIEDFTSHRDKLLDAMADDVELRHAQPNRDVESWKADALDTVGLLRTITSLRLAQLLPRSRSNELKSRMLPLLSVLPADASDDLDEADR
jgi:hypothetical protein